MDDTMFKPRLAALSLEQKVRLLTGADSWGLPAEPAIGLRRVVTSDGPAGARGERWDERDPSANVPSPTALAATWDEARIERLGRLLAAECRRKGVDVLLAPTVNLHRTPYGGRHFECYSEDPLLTARIGTAYVRGLQAAGVGATVKHFVANDSETERYTLDARVDERTLRELYLAPFEAIVADAQPWAVMAAYNAVNGPTMTEHPMLRDILKDEWGFNGVVMSDWYAARTTAPAGRAALDLVMPGPTGPWGDALVAAVRLGDVDEATIDDKVVRLLRMAARAGALAGFDPPTKTDPWSDAAIAAELRATAAAGFVLARNDRDLLPLDRGNLRRVAVLGPNAAAARTQGGGSATVFPPYTVSPLDGLRAALGPSVDIAHSPGVHSHTRVPVAAPHLLQLPDGSGSGVEVSFLAADGTVLGHENRRAAAWIWQGHVADGVPIDQVAAITARTRIRAETAGEHVIGCSGVGDFRLTLGGNVMFDEKLTVRPGTDPGEAHMRPPQRAVPVTLEPGGEIEVELHHERRRRNGGTSFAVAISSFQLNVQQPQRSEDDEIEHAVTLARDADVAIVIVGTNEEVESEGFDRDSLALPGRQDELVHRVAAVNQRTVVVVNAGAPVLTPWTDDVAAVLLVWFPGQEFGHALADVLLGTLEPGGRLPTTWPASIDALPSTRPTDGVLAYDEGIFIGYRAYDHDGRQPRFPFGHGLGYTDWEYLDIEIPSPGTACVRLRNTGARRGREVVQLYASRPGSTIERPPCWLAGFAIAEADPGETVTVEIAIPDRSLAHWDTDTHTFAVESGPFELSVGRSSRDTRLRAELLV